MERKKCIKPSCGRIFKEGDPDFADGHCACGAPLMLLQEAPVQKAEPVVTVRSEKAEIEAAATVEATETSQQQVPTVTTEWFLADGDVLVFPGDEVALPSTTEVEQAEEATEPLPERPEGISDADQLLIYHEGEVVETIPLLYDEMIIGRVSSEGRPDIDLTAIDPKLCVSRRHAMIYRQKGVYYIRNLSSKNSLHVDGESVLRDENRKLNDGAQIVLSRMIGLEFWGRT